MTIQWRFSEDVTSLWSDPGTYVEVARGREQHFIPAEDVVTGDILLNGDNSAYGTIKRIEMWP